VSFTDEQRNELRRLVDDLREMLVDDLADILQGLGIDRDGAVKPESALGSDHREHAQRIETRRLLLRLLGVPDEGCQASQECHEGVGDHLRSIAFTHLHRFVAFKMMEAPGRKVFREIVGPKRATGEIMRWLAEDAPEGLDKQWDVGHPDTQDRIYRDFLQALCAKLHPELGAIFDAEDLATRIFPRRWKEVLARLNDDRYKDYWDRDETLGWVYQYYTPKSLRDTARKASPSTPRDRNELAFRNQFYTPDYVVRFLTDNTLGRLWLEMHHGSSLREVCTKLLVSPEEVLPDRVLKDPREITVLDPACGSGHFLLYCFDLFEHIYREAWDDPEHGTALRRTFENDRERFLAMVPKLIVEHNVHGIDIDRRAVQVASLALWLRARKGLPEKARRNPPRIERSGIVCAEPLPGESRDYRDFRDGLLRGQPTAARLLDRVRTMLSLAGDMGSLLHIDIPALVRDERRLEVGQRGSGQQLALLSEAPKPEQEWLDFADAKADDQFWNDQDKKLRELLAAYGSHAEGFEGTAQRLFARDGVNVLRYVDAVLATYDVVLMNPPFGAPTAEGKPEILAHYADSRQDLSACFVERAMTWVPDGLIGVLSTDAGFFRRTLEPWRRKVLLARGTMEAMAHLGAKVLDEAKVLVAAYTIRRPAVARRPALYLRVLGKQDRLERLDDMVDAVRQGRKHEEVTRVGQEAFEPLPRAAFGYWCSDTVRQVFSHVGPLCEGGVAVCQGTATAKDDRFLRLRWEVQSNAARWLPFAKGGDYSPFHDDVHLLVQWENGGAELSAFPKSFIRSAGWYGLSGLTYPLRAKRFAPRVLPSGCAFGHKGPSTFDVGPIGPLATPAPRSDVGPWTRLHEPRLFALIGLLNSDIFAHLISLGVGAASTTELSHAFEVGLLQRMPLPGGLLEDRELAGAALVAHEARHEADVWDETTAAFVLPFAKAAPFAEMLDERLKRLKAAADRYAEAVSAIESRAMAHYGFDEAVTKEVRHYVGRSHALPVPSEKVFAPRFAKDLLSWALGVTLGRFDVRLATGERSWPVSSDPFAPVLPVSPGMLPQGQSFDADLVDGDGILVDDPDHADDVARRVGLVLRRVWGGDAPALIRELAKVLQLKGEDPLREWYCRLPNGGFWEDHRKRYSKSKREAPLYAPLQSLQGHWLAWVSYHRLTKQTLYALMGERYLLRWRSEVDAALALLRAKGGPGAKVGGVDRDALDTLLKQQADLGAFEASLRAIQAWRPKSERAAKKSDSDRPAIEFEPQHDDGVLVCLAPLHAVVPWPPKGKTATSRLAEVWALLEGGELEWSRTAMRYFGKRVRLACDTDLSLAIAHGLDDKIARWKGWREELGGEGATRNEADDQADDEEDEEEDVA